MSNNKLAIFAMSADVSQLTVGARKNTQCDLTFLGVLISVTLAHLRSKLLFQHFTD